MEKLEQDIIFKIDELLKNITREDVQLLDALDRLLDTVLSHQLNKK